jgi:hypothetical protein
VVKTPRPSTWAFVKVKPDLICNGVPVEVECAERAHIGLGQALAYKYAAGRAALLVIAESLDENLKKFLNWCAQLGVETYVYINGEVIPAYRGR